MKSYNIIEERCNDLERQNLFENIREKISLDFYFKMKWKRCKEHTLTDVQYKEGERWNRSRRQVFENREGLA
jgi:hypothetical protein